MGFGSLFSGMLSFGADIDSLKKIEALKMRSLRGEDVSSEVIKTSFRSIKADVAEYLNLSISSFIEESFSI